MRMKHEQADRKACVGGGLIAGLYLWSDGEAFKCQYVRVVTLAPVTFPGEESSRLVLFNSDVHVNYLCRQLLLGLGWVWSRSLSKFPGAAGVGGYTSELESS